MISKILLFSVILGSIYGVRVSNMMYEDIQGDMACFKRFNGTHEVGCTSDYNGNVGILFVPEDEDDAISITKEKTKHHFVLVLKPTLFIRSVLMSAKNSDNINGIIILANSDQKFPSAMSHFNSCPSEEYGLYNHSTLSAYSEQCSKEPWNSVATSLLFESFSFPIFLIQSNDSVNDITSCYAKHNIDKDIMKSKWPLCAVELNSNMFGTTNSEVCLRRTKLGASPFSLSYTNFCDPVHNYNMFGTIKPLIDNQTDSSVTIVAARVDATSMFDNISPGANAAVTGLVTVLAIAEALAQFKQDFEDLDKNVMFILFEGETWDYLGSVSMTYDMNLGKFPFKPDYEDEEHVSVFNFSHIERFIEVSQVGMQDESTKLFAFTDPISNDNPVVNSGSTDILNSLKDASVKFDVNLQHVLLDGAKSYPLPPSSLQTFLKYTNISGIVLTDHSKTFKNKYYQSYLDDYKNVDYKSTNTTVNDEDELHVHLQKIASTVATSVYTLITGQADQTIEANGTIIEQLLECYLQNVNCTLFREHAGRLIDNNASGFFKPVPAKMYTGVGRQDYILTNITTSILGHFIGEEVNGTENDCWSSSSDAVQRFFLAHMGENGTCINTTVIKHAANSPAFRIDDYDFSSGQYPTWTESGWSLTSARLFLRPNPVEEIVSIVVGIVFIVITIILSYWANNKSDTLFVRSPAPVQC